MRILALIAILIGWAGMTPALAAPLDVQSTPHVRAELTASHEQATPGKTVTLLLTIAIIPGWHVYWRNPGDSGEPTSMQIRLGDGPESEAALSWPPPHAVPYQGLVNYGYEGTVRHTTTITVPQDWPEGEALPVSASVTWLVCEDICIPETVGFTLSLPVGPESQRNAIVSDMIAEQAQSVPRQSPWPATAHEAEGSLVLSLKGAELASSALEKAEFFAGRWGVIDHAAPQRLRQSAEGLTLTLTRGADRLGEAVEGVLVLTERSGNEVMRTGYEVTAPLSAAPAQSGGPNALVLVGLALLGGLILNLMPCVFPVLAIKALALVEHSGEAERRIAGGLGYTAGVMVSFAALGAVLIGFKQAGAAVGWGFQLQSPIVIFALAAIMLLVGLNLSGVYTIGGRLMGLGGNTRASSFLTGVLATIVAAPCTAPFMATAVGAALLQPTAIALGIFAALGLGLALPYLLLSISPALARALPKPGPWMEKLQQALAFPLYGTAVWLVWVLGQQVSEPAYLSLMLALVVLGFAVWALARGGRALKLMGAAGVIAVGVLSIGALGDKTSAGPAKLDDAATPYSAAKLAELRASGQPVFVNLTAAWCITCKVNERTALSSDAFHSELERRKIAYLVGDWTNQDEQITRLLEDHGRAGVPLYLAYPQSGPAIVLPQILTPAILRTAFARIAPLEKDAMP